ncbi:MAG: SDR family oxidoreductase [Candidatus Altiarchaeota archaeon]|nr:SDR family oxidoreductase [Candidatus Altiarchaeota archaeon]
MTNTALITGASSGIGLELAKIHASKGDNLVIVARRKDLLIGLKTELETNCDVDVLVVVADLSKPKVPEKIYKLMEKKKIKIKYLINNAGFGDYGEFHKGDLKLYQDMIEVNVSALTKLTRLFLPDLIKTEGKILNVASVAGFISGPFHAVYYATKAYVVSLTESLSVELKKTKVTATVLCPGLTRTEFHGAAGISEPLYSVSMSAEDVAKQGYSAMMNGKTIQVTGFINKVFLLFAKFLPTMWVANSVQTGMRLLTRKDD